MEGTPYFPESHEDASIETPEKKKDDKKKKRGSYEFLTTDKRREEAKKIAESLEKSPLFGERKPEKQEFEPKHLSKAQAAPEEQAPLEGLGEEEKREIVQELAADRKAQVEQELAAAEPGSPEASEAAEVINVLEAIEASGDVDAEIQEEPAEEAVAEAIPFEEEAEISLSSNASEKPEDSSATPIPPPSASGGSSGVPPSEPSVGASAPRRPNPVIAPSPNVYTSADMAVAEQQAGARGFIVGGIIGYLIGRRRGRIRTEKRLMPVQHKLEKEVTSLQERLAAREAKVRTLAFERLPEHKVREDIAAERPASRLGLEKPRRIERLGKTVVNAEAPREVPMDIGKIQPEHVKDMSRNELLLLSEKVVVEGASLRQIYEQHLIGERGLRHLISEYLQGKDIRKDLRKEMVEREIDFERDPILRDAAYHTTGGGAASTSLKQLLEKVGASETPDDALISVAKLKAEAQEEAAARKRTRRIIADTAMVTIIVMLAAIITILLFER
jgi:hypothetical protein